MFAKKGGGQALRGDLARGGLWGGEERCIIKRWISKLNFRGVRGKEDLLKGVLPKGGGQLGGEAS